MNCFTRNRACHLTPTHKLFNIFNHICNRSIFACTNRSAICYFILKATGLYRDNLFTSLWLLRIRDNDVLAIRAIFSLGRAVLQSRPGEVLCSWNHWSRSSLLSGPQHQNVKRQTEHSPQGERRWGGAL